ncbi:MAG: hypothetical protein MSC31_06865 [Solirubrobacteraceae bacterium MAG38_C4-C5]|nr:hypothetical protein [Candidatus Siliceabacter maunaloa]
MRFAGHPSLGTAVAVAALVISQGVEMGRPSTLRCALDGDRVRVGGDVVVLAQGTVWL